MSPEQTQNDDMPKKIFITGATDGIGYAAAKKFASQGHDLILHGRSASKLKKVTETLAALAS